MLVRETYWARFITQRRKNRFVVGQTLSPLYFDSAFHDNFVRVKQNFVEIIVKLQVETEFRYHRPTIVSMYISLKILRKNDSGDGINFRANFVSVHSFSSSSQSARERVGGNYISTLLVCKSIVTYK